VREKKGEVDGKVGLTVPSCFSTTKEVIDGFRDQGLTWIEISEELNTSQYFLYVWRADNNYEVNSQRATIEHSLSLSLSLS
jgi:hypothetical protein